MSENGVSSSALSVNLEQFQRLMLIPVDQQTPCGRSVTCAGRCAVLGGILLGDKNPWYV